MAGGWVGSVLSWAGIGNQSGKLSGAPEDQPTDKAIKYGSAIDSVGQVVNQKTTLGLSTAWACIGLKSELVASMGCGVYSKSSTGGRKSESGHWLYDLLHEEPNADQTPFEFWAGQVAAMDLWGNAFAEKETLGSRVTALTPLPPQLVTVTRDRNNQRVYLFSDRGKEERLPAEKVFHLRGITLGGDVGLSAIEYGRRTLGGAMAANKVAGDTFRGGLQLAGFIETASQKLSPEQRADLLEIFDAWVGQAMRGRVVPLEKDFKFQPLKMSPVDVQLLESRGWDVEEICRWFGMLPILIGHAAKGQTMWGSGIEQLLLGWQTLRLNPLLRRIEQAAKQQLLPRAERKLVYPEFNREAVMATDSAGRAALYSAFGQNGVMDRNEMRSRENLDHREGGQYLTVQSNLVRLDQLGTDGAASSEQQLRSALLGMLGVQGGDIEALIASKVQSMMGHNGGPSLEA
ncbi:phage portal protein [Sphingomonas sp. BK235]|uniref:phage portal protein n=1 Tax=Sphingomonas sp. BK235 TaxID=2512131 RepID=UPI00104A295E|nr:phage portal protein [Sphingomonas sp. BK235]TCP36540.1 HK97 family phage portal protein [Sphingomonas sp. BK235]